MSAAAGTTSIAVDSDSYYVAYNQNGGTATWTLTVTGGGTIVNYVPLSGATYPDAKRVYLIKTTGTTLNFTSSQNTIPVFFAKVGTVSSGGTGGLIVPDGKMLNLSATNLSIDNIPTASTSRQYNSFLLNTKDVNTIYAYANTQFYFNICYYSSDGSIDVSSTLVDNSGWKSIAINHNYDYMFMGAAYYATATFHF